MNSRQHRSRRTKQNHIFCRHHVDRHRTLLFVSVSYHICLFASCTLHGPLTGLSRLKRNALCTRYGKDNQKAKQKKEQNKPNKTNKPSKEDTTNTTNQETKQKNEDQTGRNTNENNTRTANKPRNQMARHLIAKAKADVQ